MATSKSYFNIGRKKITKEKCEANFKFWMAQLPTYDANKLKEILSHSESILPAHTFAYKYTDPKTGLHFNPIKSIFGYNEKTKEFSSKVPGLIAKAFRPKLPVPELHMRTSVKMGHDIFLFAYHGVHNPYHRLKDDVPIRPFGLFIDKENAEIFSYSHGSPCDIAEENPLVDRLNLDKYYLLPDDLRTLKGYQIHTDREIPDFWYYFGNPKAWVEEENYGKNIYKKAGEFRYFEQIKPEFIKAILWPFFTDVVLPDGTMDMDENLDLMSSFRKTFPEISVIKYNHDIDYNYDWTIGLVEASYYSMKYYLANKRFPRDADAAKK